MIIGDKRDLFADSDIILNGWKKTLLSVNVHGVNEVIQTGAHTAELIVPKPSASPVEMDLKRLTNISHGYQ